MSRGKFQEEFFIRMMVSQEVAILCRALRLTKIVRRRSAAYGRYAFGQVSTV
ncbi:MAG: hypothetical protein LUD47_02240 [Clostridia bacterium]|nr:hypothetical protein [Clostridia bacterium]